MTTALDRLVDYAISHDLIDASERTYRLNCLYGAFCPDGECLMLLTVKNSPSKDC